MTPAAGERKRRLEVRERIRVPGVRGTAIIERRLQGIPGGVKLDKALDGFEYWNVSELVRYRGVEK